MWTLIMIVFALDPTGLIPLNVQQSTVTWDTAESCEMVIDELTVDYTTFTADGITFVNTGDGLVYGLDCVKEETE